MLEERITIRPANGTWVVRAGGAVIGESKAALELRETGRDPVIYFPRADLGMAFLEPTELLTHCPYKGDAKHFSIAAKSGLIENAAWSYETPIESVADITDHIAFYSDKATVEEL